MKLMTLSFLLVIALNPLIPQELKNSSPYIEFAISAEKELESDIALLKLSVTKKSISFVNASSAVNKSLNHLQRQMQDYGIPEKDIMIRNISSTPIQNLFLKEYEVTGFMEVTIRDLKNTVGLFQLLANSESGINIESLFFDFENKDFIERQLMEAAFKKMQSRKEKYESLHGIKLKLFSITEISHDYLNGMNFSASNSPMEKFRIANSGSYSEAGSNPVKVFYQSYLVKYLIME